MMVAGSRGHLADKTTVVEVFRATGGFILLHNLYLRPCFILLTLGTRCYTRLNYYNIIDKILLGYRNVSEKLILFFVLKVKQIYLWQFFLSAKKLVH